MAGIPLNGKIIDPSQLQTELVAGGINVTALGSDGTNLFTYDANGQAADLPAGSAAILTAHTPSTAVKDQLVNALTAVEGVQLNSLTNVQRLELIKALLFKVGAIDRQSRIRPLSQWLV